MCIFCGSWGTLGSRIMNDLDGSDLMISNFVVCVSSSVFFFSGIKSNCGHPKKGVYFDASKASSIFKSRFVEGTCWKTIHLIHGEFR